MPRDETWGCVTATIRTHTDAFSEWWVGLPSRTVMSIGRVSAGNGYEYLTRSVRNDAHDYYVGDGEAPGRWTGGGLLRLGLGGQVEESEMALLFGAAAHPLTGETLSTPYRTYRTIEARIESKL